MLLASVWVGLIMHAHQGYVLIAYKQYSLETTLWAAVIALAIIFTIFYWLLRCKSTVQSILDRIHTWLNNRRFHQTIDGFHAASEGNWRTAEKKLVRGAKNKALASINYLIAAYAAQQQNADTKRDDYLNRAKLSAQPETISIELTQAQLQIANHQHQAALITLQKLRQKKPKHKFVLKLLQQTYLELQDWQTLHRLLPTLWRYRVLTKLDYSKLEQQVYLQLLRNNNNYHSMDILWQQLPRYLCKKPAFLATYINSLAELDATKAETLIKKTLHQTWIQPLVECYGNINSQKPIKQLAQAELWLKSHPNDATLLLCLGKICKNQKLWGKAKLYLEQSLQIRPEIITYYALGDLMEMQNNTQAALNYYKLGLKTTDIFTDK